MSWVKEAVQSHVDAVNRKQYAGKPVIGFDTETDGLHGPLVLASFAYPDDEGRAITGEGFLGKYLDREHRLRAGVVAGHNLGYDLKVLSRSNLCLPPAVLLDTACAAHLLDESEPYPDLGVLSKRYLNRELKSWEEVKDDPVALATYAIEDARATRDLALLFWGELEEQGLLNYWLKLECPLVPIIANMELRGIRIDRAEVERRYSKIDTELLTLEADLRKAVPDSFWKCARERCVGGTFYPKRGDPRPCVTCEGTGLSDVWLNSGDRQGEILYQFFGLPILERTEKAKKPAVDKDVLPRLRTVAEREGKHFAVRYIDYMLRYRLVSKLKSTYYGPWMEAGTDRIYPEFHQTGTVSGRWSSSKPNMQNVPAEARSCFIPDEGCAFISVDFTQIELYLLGLLSGEERILEGYAKGIDLHQITADALGVERPDGKTANFAIVYGLSPASAAKKFHKTEEEVKQIYALISRQFPRLSPYKKEVVDTLGRDGYVRTLKGRKRRLHLHSNPKTKEEWRANGRAERQAVNHTIQGSAGDLIKSAMIKGVIDGFQPVLQIHDEVIWQVSKDDGGWGWYPDEQLKNIFENACKSVNPRAEATIMSERWEAK